MMLSRKEQAALLWEIFQTDQLLAGLREEIGQHRMNAIQHTMMAKDAKETNNTQACMFHREVAAESRAKVKTMTARMAEMAAGLKRTEKDLANGKHDQPLNQD